MAGGAIVTETAQLVDADDNGISAIAAANSAVRACCTIRFARKARMSWFSAGRWDRQRRLALPG
jgi:hypothetical protein